MAIWSAEIKELERLHETFKGELPGLEKELERLIRSDDENIILVYARRCLEVIIAYLCESALNRPRGSEPLKGVIDKLLKEGKIPSHIISSMHGLNELSTYGAHPKDFDPEQVKPVLNNLDIIIKWYLKYKNTGVKARQPAEAYKDYSEKVVEKPGIEEQGKFVRINKHKLLSGALITIILLIAAIFAWQKIFRRNTLEKLRSSGGKIAVAVMPFQNMTNDTTMNIWQEAIQYNLTNFLSNYSGELRVSPTETISGLLQKKGLDSYSSYAAVSASVARNVSKQLDADVFINGSINQSGSRLRLIAQLTDSQTEEILKPFQIDGKVEEIIPLIDSLKVLIKDFLLISGLGKGLAPDFLSFTSANSPEAFRYFRSAQNAFNERDWTGAEKFYSRALSIDSNFTGAYTQLAFSYLNQGKYDQAKKICLELLKRSGNLPPPLKTMAAWYNAHFFETPHEEIFYAKQLIEIDDLSPSAHFALGMSYWGLEQYDNMIPEYEKALKIYEKLGIKPSWTGVYSHLGWAYYATRKYKRANQLYNTMEKGFPDNPDLLIGRARLALIEDDTEKSDQYLDKLRSVRKDKLWTEARILSEIAGIYSNTGKLIKAEEFFRHSLSLEPENPARLNNLAFHLIDKDIDITEGIDLADRALETNQDGYEIMDTKGWGLYKQGKYQQALEILQKSWEIRREQAVYDHQAFLRLEAAEKAAANKMNN
jgi:tetratricopeptide (TPR) repeat protein